MGGAIGRLLGTGARAEVYEWDDHVIKLYRAPDGKTAAFREAAIQAAVEELGLPVPAVRSVQQVNGRWGVVFDRVRGAPFAERMRDNPGKIPLYLEQLARLHLRIHSHLAAQFAGLKQRLASSIAAADLIDREQKTILLKGLAGMPDGDRLCHGDFHPLNILGDVAQPVVIDWPDARRGDPAADVCRSYLLMRLHADEFAEPYLDAYCRASSLPREAVIRWLPYIAAARLSENVGGEANRLLAILRPARP
jgi:aminoglycoside phosphotransferase (APT) family kinase protein